MYIEPTILSAVSALTGAFMGGGASLIAALYTQRCQNRIQRATREVTKRETVYAEFIMNASKSLLNAYLYDEIRLDSEQQALIGIANRMRLFAPTKVIEEAERIIRTLIQISLEPRVRPAQARDNGASGKPSSGFAPPIQRGVPSRFGWRASEYRLNRHRRASANDKSFALKAIGKRKTGKGT